MFLEHDGLIEQQPFGVTPILFLAACAAGCLDVVSGATRKTALPHQLDAPPSIESAVFPALVPSPIAVGDATREQR